MIETKPAAAGIVLVRTIFEDMPQVIMTLVIDHYRIQQGRIESISNFELWRTQCSILTFQYSQHELEICEHGGGS